MKIMFFIIGFGLVINFLVRLLNNIKNFDRTGINSEPTYPRPPKPKPMPTYNIGLEKRPTADLPKIEPLVIPEW